MVKKTSNKKYTPSQKEKYMCAKHKKFFTEELVKWKKDIIKANNLGNLLNSSDDSILLKWSVVQSPILNPSEEVSELPGENEVSSIHKTGTIIKADKNMRIACSE